LNALIYKGNSTIEDLEILNLNLPPKAEGLKDSYMDVKVKLQDESLVIIEIQVLNVQCFGKRVFYNAANTYGFQLQGPQAYRLLEPVITLTITDFEMLPDNEDFMSRFVLKEVTENFTYPENDLDLVFVELPKFTKQEHELETLADKWIYFMKNARSLTSVPENMDSIPEIHKAFDMANQSNLSNEEVEDLNRIEQSIHDQQRAIVKAVQEGIEEGIQLDNLAIAQKLLSQLDNATISQVTGLSVEEVQNLRTTNS
jgi:predicted transposase/invertase (TIGR01784 family)